MKVNSPSNFSSWMNVVAPLVIWLSVKWKEWLPLKVPSKPLPAQQKVVGEFP
jgi:hypothetical protein